MSIYILEAFILSCKAKGIEPSWQGLKEWKENNWRD